MYNYPWIAFTGLCAIYLASIPLAVMRYRYHKKRTATEEEAGPEGIGLE